MKKQQKVIQFRGDEEVYRRAHERLSNGAILFPDVMRAALKAIAEGDVAPFSEIINEASTEHGDATNYAWLYHKCHELFEYCDGQLLRKSRKGMGEQGTPAYIRIRDGEEHVLIQGNHYPLKDIVWLMANGSISGEIVYKNPYKSKNKHAIENLLITHDEKEQISISKYINRSERIGICCGKQRALLINVENDIISLKALEQLINNGETIPLLLRGDDGWIASRTAIHAFRLYDNQYVVSIS